MSNLTLALLAACVVVAGVPLVAAEHDENSEKRADCENADNQGWIGYNSSRTARYIYENASKGETVFTGDATVDGAINNGLTTVVMDNCEGEHWDGQDSVNNAEANEPTSTADATCTPKLTESAATDFSVTNCQRADINSNGDGPLGRAPLALRASGKGSGNTNYQEAYVGLDIMLVGRVAVYAGTCTDGSPGLEGAQKCDSVGSTKHGRASRTAVYLRDNTPNNVLAQVVSSAGLTRGEVGEADCSQERYYQGVEQGRRDLCQRDNTAATVDLLLP